MGDYKIFHTQPNIAVHQVDASKLCMRTTKQTHARPVQVVFWQPNTTNCMVLRGLNQLGQGLHRGSLVEAVADLETEPSLGEVIEVSKYKELLLFILV